MNIQLNTLLDRVNYCIRKGDSFNVEKIVQSLSAAEIARLIESLAPNEKLSFWRLLPNECWGEVLLELHRETRISLINNSNEEKLLESLANLQMDELADIDADLPPSVVKAMVLAMDYQRLQRYKLVCTFPDDSAGGLMDADATAIRKDVSLKAVCRYLCQLRVRDGSLPEQLDQLIVVDRNNHVKGALPLVDLVSLDNKLTVEDVMNEDIPLINPFKSAEEVARLFDDLNLISAPVVDENNRLLGRITVDDVIDNIVDSSQKVAYAKEGLNSDLDMFSSVTKTSLQRAIWLGINLVTAFIAAWVIGLFEASIEKLVALAVLMPIVASMGGITGSQTLTIVTRGLALDQIGKSNIFALTLHELKVSVLNGALWATVVYIVTLFWYGAPYLAGVFAFAIFIVSITGTLSGAIIPMTLSRFNIDPAIAGGVILTTITDAIGFFVFLGIATLVLL